MIYEFNPAKAALLNKKKLLLQRIDARIVGGHDHSILDAELGDIDARLFKLK